MDTTTDAHHWATTKEPARGTAGGSPSPGSSSTQGEASRVETRSIEYVPLAERHGKTWNLFNVWFAGDAHLATIATGLIGITLGGNLIWTAIAVVAGCAFGTFFMAFHSTQGPQLGLPQMVQSRPQFGYIGALLVWVVALIIYVGYNAFNEVLLGSTLQNLLGVPTAASYVGYGVIGVLLAIVGYDLIHRASQWMTYLMVFVLILFTIGILVINPFTAQELDLSTFALVPFLAQFFASAVYQLSWAIYVSDYSRYLPPNVGVRSSFWWTYLGAGVGGAWMMLVGTVAGGLFPRAEAISGVISAGNQILPHFGIILILASALPLITIGVLQFYGGSLTLLSSLDSFKQVTPTLRKRIGALVTLGVLATALAFAASGSFVTQFGAFLTVLGYLLTPWTAINLIDFYIVRHGHYSIREIFNPHGMYHRWAWRGLAAYIIGFLAMVPFGVIGGYEGPLATLLGGIDISMLVGLVISSVIYLLLSRHLDLDAERDAITTADTGLDPDTNRLYTNPHGTRVPEPDQPHE